LETSTDRLFAELLLLLLLLAAIRIREGAGGEGGAKMN